MVHHLKRAFIFSIIINLLYYVVVPIISGMFLTHFYVPDVVNAYDNVKYLQNEVEFGVINRTNFSNILLSLLAGIGIYGLLITTIHFFKKGRP
ncbi:hypothetical protein [Brevibacillus sp. MER 51]|uniref:hypothetical protein n=1 Tax=Brevibacillus sp. MER 51 TaxID=2939560 RepID=UPI002559ADC1|nr:hypothetical protein [Brevibacillus sp. MER 51]